jgi:hypothetical protein
MHPGRLRPSAGDDAYVQMDADAFGGGSQAWQNGDGGIRLSVGGHAAYRLHDIQATVGDPGSSGKDSRRQSPRGINLRASRTSLTFKRTPQPLSRTQ